MNLRIVCKTLGILAILIGLTMGLCWLYAWIEWRGNETDEAARSVARALGISTGITMGTGLVMYLSGLGCPNEVLRREAIVIVGLSWVQAGLFGALPYTLSTPGLDPVGAFFESVSGFTTTGASVMREVEAFPRPILLWRSVTQWLGGIGILVVFVAVLSFLGVGSRSLVQQESSLNISASGISRIRDLAASLLKVYLILSLLCYLGLLFFGMGHFDAVCHAMATIATGGFSTKNLSIAHFQSPAIEIWLTFFMFLSAIGFMFYIFVANRRWSRVRAEEEGRYYLFLVAGAGLLVYANLLLASGEAAGTDGAALFRETFFNVVSISSTTGFALTDYDRFPLFSRMLLILLMLIGGCAGSTAGGLKMNRVLLYAKISARELVRSFRPNQVFRIRLNGVVQDERVFLGTSFLIALGFVLTGFSLIAVSALEPTLDLFSVVGAVIGTLWNIGPGFGMVGPTGNFSSLHSTTHLLLAFLMILGRLEFFAILALFVPSLWRKY